MRLRPSCFKRWYNCLCCRVAEVQITLPKGEMMKNYIWVVEMQNDISLKFEPTVGVGLTRKDGRDEKRKWKTANPDDKFRLKKYVAL